MSVDYNEFTILAEGILVHSSSTQFVGPFKFNVDPLQNVIRWAPLDSSSTEVYTLHFIYGHNKTMSITTDLSNEVVILGFTAKDNSAVVRILRPKIVAEADYDAICASDVEFEVNGTLCHGNRKYLSLLSSPFDKLLNGPYLEAGNTEIPIKLGVTAPEFQEFLMAISFNRMKPKPTNVVAFLELSRFFDIPFLMKACEEHLKHCREIDAAHRLLLAQEYRLNDLKGFLFETTTEVEWRSLYAKDNNMLDKFNAEMVKQIAEKLLSCESKRAALKPPARLSNTVRMQIIANSQ
ncbi:BTB/POZ domain-containing protein [Ditylenchus destructor]|uniref:BTB/POZ domain-containing protein n=1 Tax=Ditylenchus destructor TaxID=166010 RepID=A0AAD4N0Q2_9BILA|nr:BTB/POZ domain-containing protein [Ditylenchus destructor]